MKNEGTDKWGYELASKTLSPTGQIWRETNYGLDFMQGRLNVNTDGIVPGGSYFHQRSNSQSSKKSFTSQGSTRKVGGGIQSRSSLSGGYKEIKRALGRPASMLTS